MNTQTEQIERPLRAVVAGFDAGAYGLPETVIRELTAYRAIVAELERVRTEANRPGEASESTLADAVVAAARDGAELPDVAELLARAEIERLAAGREVRVFELATEMLANATTAALWRQGREIIVSFLRPALGEVLEGLRGSAEVLRGVTLSAEVLQVAEAKVRRAAVAVMALTDRYAAIRAAYNGLKLATELRPKDGANRWEEIKNLDTIWPNFQPVLDKQASPPWPSNPAERLVWLIHAGAELWLPLPEEQDAELERFAEELQERRQHEYGQAARRRSGVGIVR